MMSHPSKLTRVQPYLFWGIPKAVLLVQTYPRLARAVGRVNRPPDSKRIVVWYDAGRTLTE
jgi:hypothetical protein